MNTTPNHALQANGGIVSQFQSAHAVATVAELQSLGGSPHTL
jgi:hypothetical protein